MKTKLLSKIICNVLAVIVGLLTVGGAIANANASAINSFLGVSTQKVINTGTSTPVNFYDTQYKSVDELRAASEAINEKALEEGMVLLKNDNNALPLSAGASVSLYSANSVTFVYAGSGSSSNLTENVTANAVNLKDGLTAAGLSVNEGLWNWYMANDQYWQGSVVTDKNGNKYSTVSGNRKQGATFVTKDAPWSALPTDATNQADAAILVVSRNGGENADFAMNTKSAGMTSGDYLSLGDNERDVLTNLKRLKEAGTIGKIVVLINSANQLECDFADNPDYGVDAVLWVGVVGSTGTNAIGRVLTGAVNPSGRLADTYFYQNKANPVYDNYGIMEYDNADILPNAKNSHGYIVYKEGIYNGYRYTETRYEDYVLGQGNAGEYEYAQTVSYPFGYGLSYTTFATRLDGVERFVNKDNSVTYNVTATVTNTGATSGKHVVQVYLQKPYTAYDRANGVEKAAVELVGYAKTDVLAAGASQTVTISVAERRFAAYDANEAKTYVIGSTDSADNYYLTVADNAHEATNNVLAKKGVARAANPRMDKDGNAANVWNTHIEFDAEKYSTNETIKSANFNFTARYDGEQANYGVSKITNQFDDVDFLKYDGFDEEDRAQVYTSRNDWTGTLRGKITLTATNKLASDMATPTPEQDPYDYPTSGADNATTLALLRADEEGNLLDYSNPLWEDLLDKITWKEMCAFLSNGLRLTEAIGSINAPQTLQFNGAVGPVPGDAENNSKYDFNSTGAPWEGFAKELGSGTEEYPNFFVCNGIVAATYNTALAEELGKQIGEECLWAGMSGIYGYGINLHRGSYCGRNFEYYSEDGFLTGMACAYEVKGTQSKGVFVILKHALLNEQETNRHAMGVWANEQSIRELYLTPIELCIEYGDEMRMMGMMTGLNRMGAKWSSIQGFCNIVLRGEMGMNGFVISDFYPKNEKDAYMNPVAGVMYGNDLPDGTVVRSNSTFDGVTNDFDAYSVGYGKLAWQMRDATHRVLYVVARSAAMNKITNDTVVVKITPAWQVALKASTITAYVLFAASIGFVAFSYLYKRKTAKA